MCKNTLNYRHAGVAQLAEQLIRNQQVGGSSPLAGTRKSMSYLAFRFVRAVRVDFWVDFLRNRVSGL